MFIVGYLFNDFCFCRAAFQEELVMKDKGQVVTDEWVWDEEAHHEKCMTYNDAENRRMREIRLVCC